MGEFAAVCANDADLTELRTAVRAFLPIDREAFRWAPGRRLLAANGTKVWTSGAHLAHEVVVLARTSLLDPAHRHAESSQFIVPTKSVGTVAYMAPGGSPRGSR